MTFAADISDSKNQRVVLAEVDIPLIFTSWINYQAGIWYTKLLDANQAISDSSGVVGYYYANVAEIPDKIGSCLVDSEFFTKVTSIALCISTEKSFYHDEDTDQVYIHFEDWAAYVNQIIRLGAVNGFSLNQAGGYYFGETYYEPRLSSISPISTKKNTLFSGVQATKAFNLSFLNGDGKFDDWNDLNIYGQPVRILIGIVGYTYAEFEQIAEGFVEKYPYSSDTMTITARDKRKNLSKKIPFNTFSQDFYPDLNDDDVGKYKPVVFGAVYYYPVVCINKEESGPVPTTRKFMFLDTETGSADVANTLALNVGVNAYIKNDEDNNIFDQVTITSIDIDSGIIEIVSTAVDNDDNVPRDVFFTGVGYADSTEVVEALEYIIDSFSSITYNSTFFNTVEITTEFSDSVDIGYLMEKPEEIEKAISKFMFADDGYFYVQNDGRFSAKKYDNDRASTETIQDYSWITEPNVNPGTGKFLTSVTVSGREHIAKGEYLSNVENTTYEAAGLRKYKKFETKEIDTLIVLDAEVATKAENIMLQTKDIVKEVSRIGDMSLYDIDIMDFITANHERTTAINKIWEVTGKTFNPMNWTINLDMKYNREV